MEEQSLLRRLHRRLGAIIRNDRGNIAIIAAFMLLPLTLAVGMGVDYTFASYRQDQIDGFADAAALAGVTPAMMTKTDAQAQAAVQAVFDSQIASMPNISYAPSDISIGISDSTGSALVSRKITVSYKAGSHDIFGALLGKPTISIGGVASATSSVAPRIDFYLLLDDSPSMAIASTSTDIATMVSHTAPQGGCAFACHETNPAADNLQNPKNITCVGDTQPNKSFPNGGEDNFALARCLGVVLRVDLVNQATQNLLTYAAQTEAQNNTTYRTAIYTMDYNVNAVVPTPVEPSTVTGVNIQQLEVYDNSCLTQTNCNNDQDSYLDAAMQYEYNKLPTPGNGTSNTGDTPQEVLFVVSDGVNDYANGGRIMSPINSNSTWCQQIKNRGIRIAFLYLTYNPLPTNSFYNSNIAPFQSQIATDAQNCASAGLYFEVNTGGDISAAMTALFARAVATAHLTQ
jgi:Flp pilus assembly protein TadG